MIDTVILKIKYGKFEILNPLAFAPNADSFFKYGVIKKATNYPTKKDYLINYKPRLELCRVASKKNPEIILKVEFSVPKILFNNNLYEVEENDFLKIVDKLQEKIALMGVFIEREALINAPVTAFHASKNIMLSDRYTSTYVLRELSKISLPKKLDLTKITYKNGGQSLQYYSRAHSLVFYDKLADLSKGYNSRPFDCENYQKYSKELEKITKTENKKVCEILKIEARLSTKRKMNAVLDILGFPKNPAFKDVFKTQVCRKTLGYYWQSLIEERNYFLFSKGNCPASEVVIFLKSGKRPRDALELLGLHTLIEKIGIRETENILGKKEAPRLSKQLKELNKLLKIQPPIMPPYVLDIKKSIANLKPITRDDFY